MIRRSHRFDLTPLLDVLLIVFFASLIKVATADNTEAEVAEASASDALDEAENARRALADLEAALRDAQRAQDDSTARADETTHSRDAMAERMADLESLLNTTGLFEEIDSASGGALQELLQERLVIVSFFLSGNEVRTYQRFGDDERSELRHPVRLTQIRPVADQNGPDAYRAQYIGDFFPRLFEVLDASLIQNTATDQTFYLIVPDDTNICETFWGLAREIRANQQIQVILPKENCPEESLIRPSER